MEAEAWKQKRHKTPSASASLVFISLELLNWWITLSENGQQSKKREKPKPHWKIRIKEKLRWTLQLNETMLIKREHKPPTPNQSPSPCCEPIVISFKLGAILIVLGFQMSDFAVGVQSTAEHSTTVVVGKILKCFDMDINLCSAVWLRLCYLFNHSWCVLARPKKRAPMYKMIFH